MLTAAQKIRLTLTGNPSGELHFQHEGEEVTRWITGGSIPDLYVTFHQRDTMIDVLCSTCHALLGSFPADYTGITAQQLAAMRQGGHQH
jgi:hypothetical protein